MRLSRTRALALGMIAVISAIMLTSCTTAEYAQWIGLGQVDPATGTHYNPVTPAVITPGQQAVVDHVVYQAQLAAWVEAVQRAEAERPSWPTLDPFLVCVRRHESDRGGYPHAGGYRAQNPTSSASGAYQFINSTWRVASARAGHGGYSTAASAPEWVQDAVALDTVARGGRSAWNGTRC